MRRVARRVRPSHRALERASGARGWREFARSAEALASAPPVLPASVVNAVRIVHLSLSPAAGRTRGGIQRGVRPQLSKGAPTPAPSTGDASLSLLYSRSASALCAPLGSKNQKAKTAPPARARELHDHDLRQHALRPARRFR